MDKVIIKLLHDDIKEKILVTKSKLMFIRIYIELSEDYESREFRSLITFL
jgi:hypothetical protein